MLDEKNFACRSCGYWDKETSYIVKRTNVEKCMCRILEKCTEEMGFCPEWESKEAQ